MLMKLFQRPTIQSIIDNDLYEAQRGLLEAAKQLEYAKALAEVMALRVRRLQDLNRSNQVQANITQYTTPHPPSKGTTPT